MGQCKSKVQVLDESDLEHRRAAAEEARIKKANKRRWRKSKGYSLSASLEGNLDLGGGGAALLTGSRNDLRSIGGGPVLLSYNVREERKKMGAAAEEERAGSLPPPVCCAGGEEQNDEECCDDHEQDPVLQRSGDGDRVSSDRSAISIRSRSSSSSTVQMAAPRDGWRPVDKLRLVPAPSFSFGSSCTGMRLGKMTTGGFFVLKRIEKLHFSRVCSLIYHK